MLLCHNCFVYICFVLYIYTGANILVTRGNVLKIADWGLGKGVYITKNTYTSQYIQM